MARQQSLHHIVESSLFSLPPPIKGWNLLSSCLSHGIQVNLSNNSNVDVKGTEGDNRSTETEIMALHDTYMYLIFWWHFFAVFRVHTPFWTKNSRTFQGHIFHFSRTPRPAKSIGIMIVFTCFLPLGVATFLPVAYIVT